MSTPVGGDVQSYQKLFRKSTGCQKVSQTGKQPGSKTETHEVRQSKSQIVRKAGQLKSLLLLFYWLIINYVCSYSEIEVAVIQKRSPNLSFNTKLGAV